MNTKLGNLLNLYNNCSLDFALEHIIPLIKQNKKINFNESLELHIRLNLDKKTISKKLKGIINLPYDIGKKQKIWVLTEDENSSTMLALGANNAGLNNVIDLLKTNINDCDILLTTPNLMSKLIPLGRLLGPKNLLPSLKNGTLTTNLEFSVLDFKKGKLEYQVDKFGIIHLVFGKLSFNLNDLKENIKVILNSINKLKLKTTKNFIKSFYICSTMSSAIKINVSTVNCYI